MRRFHFTMEHVLHLRELRKEHCERAFVKARAALAEEERKLALLDEMIKAALDPEKTFKYPNGAFFLQRERHLKSLRDRRNTQDLAVRFAKAKLAEANRALHQASVELKQLEKMREREFQRWQAEANREERKLNDEMGVAMWHREFAARLVVAAGDNA